MLIGELRHKVTIQSKTSTSDGAGGFTESWADTEKVYASVWNLSSREFSATGRVSGDITHKVRIRYISGVTRSQRIKFEKDNTTRYFNIAAPPINIDERNQWLELLCKEST